MNSKPVSLCLLAFCGMCVFSQWFSATAVIPVLTVEFGLTGARDAGLLPIIELCDALQNVVIRIFEGADNPPEKEFQLMKQVSYAIRQSFTVSDREAVLVHDVAHAVSSRG